MQSAAITPPTPLCGLHRPAISGRESTCANTWGGESHHHSYGILRYLAAPLSQLSVVSRPLAWDLLYICDKSLGMVSRAEYRRVAWLAPRRWNKVEPSGYTYTTTLPKAELKYVVTTLLAEYRQKD
jgi:hypothetical protein